MDNQEKQNRDNQQKGTQQDSERKDFGSEKDRGKDVGGMQPERRSDDSERDI